MTKQTIEVEGLPEGWKAVAFRLPVTGEFYVSVGGEVITACRCSEQPRLIVEKIQPRRIVLEETTELNEKYQSGFYATRLIAFKDGSINLYDMKYLWREVKETDLSLNSDKTKVSIFA
jgi:hypothetical protein